MTPVLTQLQAARNKRRAPGPLSPDAVDLCAIIDHLFTITLQENADIRADWRRMQAEIDSLKTRLFKLENRGYVA